MTQNKKEQWLKKFDEKFKHSEKCGWDSYQKKLKQIQSLSPVIPHCYCQMERTPLPNFRKIRVKEIKKMNTTEQAIRDKILYIGNEIPKSLMSDKRPKFIVLGTPQEFIDETSEPSNNPKMKKIICYFIGHKWKGEGKFIEGEQNHWRCKRCKEHRWSITL